MDKDFTRFLLSIWLHYIVFMEENMQSSWKIASRFGDSEVVLHCGDSFNFMRRQIPDDSIKLQFTSPPYNIGKIYEKKSELSDYLTHQEQMIGEMYRICHPQGSIGWQVGNFVEDGEVFPLDYHFYYMFKKLGMKLRNRIIWRFEHGLHAKSRFSGRYETVLWWTKGEDYTFHLDPVRIPSKYPGKRHFKGEKKGQPSCNPAGKNPGDLWDLKGEWESLIWNIPNVKANHVEKTSHPCQFPVELAERFVLALTDSNDYVYDPYSGVGTTAIAAIKNGRQAVGSEILEIYHSSAVERCEALRNGTLRFRQIGKEVHTPSGKVAAIPKEWIDEGFQEKVLPEPCGL